MRLLLLWLGRLCRWHWFHPKAARRQLGAHRIRRCCCSPEGCNGGWVESHAPLRGALCIPVRHQLLQRCLHRGLQRRFLPATQGGCCISIRHTLLPQLLLLLLLLLLLFILLLLALEPLQRAGQSDAPLR